MATRIKINNTPPFDGRLLIVCGRGRGFLDSANLFAIQHPPLNHSARSQFGIFYCILKDFLSRPAIKSGRLLSHTLPELPGKVSTRGQSFHTIQQRQQQLRLYPTPHGRPTGIRIRSLCVVYIPRRSSGGGRPTNRPTDQQRRFKCGVCHKTITFR